MQKITVFHPFNLHLHPETYTHSPIRAWFSFGLFYLTYINYRLLQYVVWVCYVTRVLLSYWILSCYVMLCHIHLLVVVLILITVCMLYFTLKIRWVKQHWAIDPSNVWSFVSSCCWPSCWGQHWLKHMGCWRHSKGGLYWKKQTHYHTVGSIFIGDWWPAQYYQVFVGNQNQGTIFAVGWCPS